MKDNIYKINNIIDNNYIDYIYDKDLNMIKNSIFDYYLNGGILNINYNKLYRFATEDINSYMKSFKNMTDYLTVCGSSEQVLNGILKGAKNIDVFDINYFAKHALALRIGAIKSLTRKEFMSFYYNRFDYNLFLKILNNLDKRDYIFWSKIYLCFGKVLINNLFYNNRLTINDLININPYLQDNNYEILKELIDKVNINFIESDFYNIITFINNKKYDVINLSNIYEYINFDKFATLTNAYKYIEFIKYLKNNHLKDNSTIMFAYMYKWSKKVKQYFDKLYQENHYLVSIEDCTKEELLFRGMTYQNLSYSMLYDVIDFDYEEIITNSCFYGKSVEQEHDVALVLRRDNFGNSKNNSR